GQPVPETLVGRSFLSALRGEEPDAPRTAVSGFMNGWRTLAVGRYKLIQRTLDHAWLYDTKVDPNEKNDLHESQPIALRYTRGLMGLALAEQQGTDGSVQKARKHEKRATPIDPETEAQLRALG